MAAKSICKHDESAPINVWVGNLRKYNEGELSGGWVALPVDNTKHVFDALGIDADRDEYHIPDWDCGIPGLEYSEYADLDDLNRKARKWLELSEWEREAVGVRMELCGEGFEEALENTDDVRIWYGCRDMEAVAMEYCDECGILDRVPDELRYYFDFEALGRDMGIERSFEYSANLGCMVEAF